VTVILDAVQGVEDASLDPIDPVRGQQAIVVQAQLAPVTLHHPPKALAGNFLLAPLAPRLGHDGRGDDSRQHVEGALQAEAEAAGRSAAADDRFSPTAVLAVPRRKRGASAARAS
jgi:hypothetical protein